MTRNVKILFVVVSVITALVFIVLTGVLYAERLQSMTKMADQERRIKELEEESRAFIELMQEKAYHSASKVEQAKQRNEIPQFIGALESLHVDVEDMGRKYQGEIKDLHQRLDQKDQEISQAQSSLRQELEKRDRAISDIEKKVEEERVRKELAERMARESEAERKKLQAALEPLIQRVKDLTAQMEGLRSKE